MFDQVTKISRKKKMLIYVLPLKMMPLSISSVRYLEMGKQQSFEVALQCAFSEPIDTANWAHVVYYFVIDESCAILTIEFSNTTQVTKTIQFIFKILNVCTTLIIYLGLHLLAVLLRLWRPFVNSGLAKRERVLQFKSV